jgi:hypothetical protein
MLQRLLPIFILLSCALPAWSAPKPFFEPYIGIGKLEIHSDNSLNGTFVEIANGFFLGGKLGLNLGQKAFAGLDYHTAGPYEFSTTLTDTEWNHTMMGAGLGMDYKIIRFWAGYYFESEFDDTTNDIMYTGTAVKAGFGLVASRKLRANLDLVWYDIEKYKSGSFSAELPGGLDIYSTHVSISIPLEF